MADVGIRALKQNASAVVARAEAGETLTITDHGRPVAQITPLGRSRVQTLVDSGRARRPRRRLADLGVPDARGDVSAELRAMRDAERF
jgi:prevent-host-death family protein